MRSFWQNTQPSVQPPKNTVPLPFVPLMHGSSHICRAARATTGKVPMRQKPSPVSGVRMALHFRGQRLHSGILIIPVCSEVKKVYHILCRLSKTEGASFSFKALKRLYFLKCCGILLIACMCRRFQCTFSTQCGKKGFSLRVGIVIPVAPRSAGLCSGAGFCC